MIRQNMGRLDRTVRCIVGVALIPIGLFALGGWHGSLAGIPGLIAAAPVRVPAGARTPRFGQPEAAGRALTANVWITILPSRTTKVSVPSS